VPQSERLLAYDPASHAVVLVGQSLANTPKGVDGTWRWTGHRWALLSSTSPEGADTMAYAPVSRRLLADGGQEPFTPGPRMGAPSAPGYARTWAFTGRHWSELHAPTPIDRAPGVLTISPDGFRLLLINTHGHIWSWTGRDWQRRPADDAPATGHPPWKGATLSAPTDPAREQILLLVTGDANDETWTLHDDRWTRYPQNALRRIGCADRQSFLVNGVAGPDARAT
jgi:hypothetical protein